MVALSVSRVIRPSSTATVSPSATRISITSTSDASPMSGTVTSISSSPAGSSAAASVADSAAGADSFFSAGALSELPEPATSSSNTSEPSLTLSPSFTFTSTTLPACGLGTSMVALSVSRVIRPSSASTVSPALTRISITSTSAESPISGTVTSIVSLPPLLCSAAGFCSAAGSSDLAAGADSSLAAGASSAFSSAAESPPATSSLASKSLWLILSPTFTHSSLSVPAKGAGTSMLALSLSTVTRASSASTESPGDTHSSMTSTSSSPKSGTNTSLMSDIVCSLPELMRTAG